MRFSFIFYLIGLMLVGLGVSMCWPLLFAIYFFDQGIMPLFASACLSSVAGLVLYFSFKSSQVAEISRREGILIVTLCWTSVCVFGSLPYHFSEHIPHFTDCIFESVSGFTTTGATILSDIESLPRSILIWRDMTQWIGGMGIILLALAVLPLVGSGGMQLYRAEFPGPVEEKLQPKIKDTAKNLWKIYVFLTVLGILLLYLGGMHFWESMCNVFGSVSTGGFNPRNASIGSYNNPYVDIVMIVLMLAGGINFSLHYWMLKGKPLRILRDPEFRFYFVLLAGITLASSISIYYAGIYTDFFQALRYGAFQIVSIGTSTGFATADYELWTPLAHSLLLICMFGLGCAGSTSGGIKSIRSLLVLKSAYREIQRLVHPRGIFVVKLKGQKVSPDILNGIWGFLILYFAATIVATLLLAGMGEDLVTSFSAVIASIGCVGPSFGEVGPTDNYLHLSGMAKWILMLCMLLGRLEIYSVLVLLLPGFWSN